MPKTQKIHKYEVKRCGGNEVHKRNGLRHRDDDLPAVTQYNGVQEWCQKGKLHRDGDQPARVCPAYVLNPSMGVLGYDRVFLGWYQEWYQHGKRHRDNGLPAVVCYNGHQEWYQHGVKQTYEEIMKKQAIVTKTIMIALYQRRILRIPWDVVRWELSRFL